MRIMIALGAGAVLRHGTPTAPVARQRAVDAVAQTLARIADENEVVIARGCGAEIGFMLELGLRNALPDRDVVTLLSQVVVGGEGLAPGAAATRALTEPRAIVGLQSLRVLIDAGALVICASGDRIPVAVGGDGTMRGVAAEVDKDLTAALLARRLDADLLLMLTGVDAPHDREHGLGSPSMRSKVEAARSFVEATRGRAAIGASADAVQIVRGAAGTQITPSAHPA